MDRPTSWLHMVSCDGHWELRRERGPTLGEFETWEDAAEITRVVAKLEGAEFIVRGESGAAART